MGFECYTVCLLPVRACQSHIRGSAEAVRSMGEAMIKMWPGICCDYLEVADLPHVRAADHEYLIYKSPLGCIQILLEPGENDSVVTSLRFAYCNPRTVVSPFCDMIIWSMKKFGTRCDIMSNLDPGQDCQLKGITDPDAVRGVVGPSVDYNRRAWQRDAGSSDELCCSPGEAVAHFIYPQLR